MTDTYPLDTDGWWSPAAPPDDVVTEDEQRRADRERIDPQGLLTPRQVDKILWEEEEERIRHDAYTPQEGDDLRTRLQLARARYEDGPDIVYKFNIPCVDCGRRLQYAGPRSDYDPTTARCDRCITPDEED